MRPGTSGTAGSRRSSTSSKRRTAAAVHAASQGADAPRSPSLAPTAGSNGAASHGSGSGRGASAILASTSGAIGEIEQAERRSFSGSSRPKLSDLLGDENVPLPKAPSPHSLTNGVRNGGGRSPEVKPQSSPVIASPDKALGSPPPATASPDVSRACSAQPSAHNSSQRTTSSPQVAQAAAVSPSATSAASPSTPALGSAFTPAPSDAGPLTMTKSRSSQHSATVSARRSSITAHGKARERDSERGDAGAMPTYHVAGPDAFDAIVQAANPRHPDHAAWVERFGGSLPARSKHAPSLAGSTSEHGHPSDSPAAAGPSASTLSGPKVRGSASRESFATASSMRKQRSESSAAKASPVLNGSHSHAQERRKSVSKHSSRHGPASPQAGAHGAENGRPRVQELFHTFPVSAPAGRAGLAGQPFGSDESDQDDDLIVPADASAAAAMSPPPPLSPPQSAPADPRRHSVDGRKRRTKKDKGKGKAAPPPVPPPRVTSSTAYQEAVMGGAIDPSGVPATPPRRASASAGPSMSTPPAATYTPGRASFSIASSPASSRFAQGHGAFGMAQLMSSPASTYSRAQSMDIPRLQQRSSSIIGPFGHAFAADDNAPDVPPIPDAHLPPSAQAEADADADAAAKGHKPRRSRASSLRSFFTGKLEAVTGGGSSSGRQTPSAPGPPAAEVSAPRASSDFSRLVRSAAPVAPAPEAGPSKPHGSGLGHGFASAGPPPAPSSNLTVAATSPYSVRAAPSTLNGRPSEVRHLSTVYQEDTEAADEFFDANEADDARSLTGGHEKADAPAPLQASPARTGAEPEAPVASASGAPAVPPPEPVSVAEKPRKGFVGRLRTKSVASTASAQSSAPSMPMLELSEQDKRNLMLQNTYYIPPSPVMRSPPMNGEARFPRAQPHAEPPSSAPAVVPASQSNAGVLRAAASSPHLPSAELGGYTRQASASRPDVSIASSSVHSHSSWVPQEPSSQRRPSGWRSGRFPSFGLRKKPSAPDTKGPSPQLPSSPYDNDVSHDQAGSVSMDPEFASSSRYASSSNVALPLSKSAKSEQGTSWRSRFMRGNSSKTNIGMASSSRTVSSPVLRSDQAGSDSVDHDARYGMLTEAVSRSLNASTANLVPASPGQQPSGAVESKELPDDPANNDMLANAPTIHKSLSPHLLSEAMRDSPGGTWRSSNLISEASGHSALESRPKETRGPEEATAAPLPADAAQPSGGSLPAPDADVSGDPDSSRRALSPLPSITAFRSLVASPAERSRTSFSMDRSRDPVMSPLLVHQQQQTQQAKSPSLLSAFRGRSRAKVPTQHAPVDSSTMPPLDPLLSPLSAASTSSDSRGPSSPRSALSPSVGLGIGGEEGQNGSAQGLLADASEAPKPPPKYSADVKAFDDMLRGFGQADKQVRQNITGKAHERPAASPPLPLAPTSGLAQ